MSGRNKTVYSVGEAIREKPVPICPAHKLPMVRWRRGIHYCHHCLEIAA